MQSKLALNGYRFDSLVETIVASPQFRNKRGPEATEKAAAPGKAARTGPGSAKIQEAKKGM
jgi:hypothetical protein